jgi:general secretion pathway protein A
LLNTRLSETQLVRTILNELGIETKARSKSDLIDTLYKTLLARIQAGRQIVVIIDEAQNLPFEVLEQVRLLSNLEADDQKLMQIVLIGQPELDEKLKEKRLRQLRQRILVYYKLRPLSREETARYIDHRLTLAGASGEPLLTSRAIRLIHRRSRGIPRLINNLCDKAFLAAFVREKDRVGVRDVRRANRELKDFLQP